MFSEGWLSIAIKPTYHNELYVLRGQNVHKQNMHTGVYAFDEVRN